MDRGFEYQFDMSNNIERESFTPPFCPHPQCAYHKNERFIRCIHYVKNGFAHTQKAPFKNQKYRCKHCKKDFSQSTFSIDYRKKKVNLGAEILFGSMNGMSNNSIALKLKVSESTIRNRLSFFARQSLLFEIEKHRKLKISETVAYDGFETFTYDQYSPCYINTAVGSTSMYTYSTTFSPLNRKGRMTFDQKKKLKELLILHGKYPTNAICKSSQYAFKLLRRFAVGRLKLVSDEHQSYTKALKEVSLDNIEHITVNSSEPRVASNPLFPINHLHRSYRHFFSSQQRETISFQKHEAGLMDKIQLMKVYKNYMRSKFVRSNKSDLDAGKRSPAMYLGLSDKILEMDEIFSRRRFVSHFKLDQEEFDFYFKKYEYSRRKIAV